jgi:hypothetical protein
VKVDNRRAEEVLDRAECLEIEGKNNTARELRDLLSDRAEMIEVIRRQQAALLELGHAGQVDDCDRCAAYRDAKALLASAEGAKKGTTG